MECQYDGCTNIGVYSCLECGKLVCGKHAFVYTNGAAKCVSCRELGERRATGGQTYAEREKADYKRMSKGCLVFPAGVVLIILAFVVSSGSGGSPNALPGILFIVGGIVALIGLGLFFAGIIRDTL